MKKIALVLCMLMINFISSAQKKPELQGGLQRFVQEKVIYPIYAQDNCIQGTVEVAFKLNKAGRITYSSVSKGIGAGLDEEALRVLRLSSGKWKVPTNYDTNNLVRSPISFSLKGYGCEQTNPASEGLALKRYRDEVKNLDKITNYYKNLDLGRKSTENEANITALKSQLGIDESYINRLVTIGERRLKQGDQKGACDIFMKIKYLGSEKGERLLNKYCK